MKLNKKTKNKQKQYKKVSKHITLNRCNICGKPILYSTKTNCFDCEMINFNDLK